MKEVLYHSVFAPNPFGHGGEKRTCQLQERHLAEGLSLSPLRLQTENHLHIASLWKTLLLLLSVYGWRGWKSLYVFMRHVKNISLVYNQLDAFFRNSDADTFYWESTGDYWYILPFLARKYGKRIMAFPHNLEALVRGKQSALFCWSNEERLHRELAVLRRCAMVFTISREETWFLQLMGLPVQYLPYELPQAIKSQCDYIRVQRHSSAKAGYLMLGSALNPPTRFGMEEVIKHWNTRVSLMVAGYGSECLQGCAENPSVKLLGTITDTQLVDLQIHCKALVVNQPPTTGALTRIEEFLVAGIPVIANTEAIGAYRCREGVSEYADWADFSKLIKQ